MTDYEIYGLLLCLIVFVVFTVLFTVMLTMLAKSTIKAIACGAEDEKIKTEYEKSLKKRKKTGRFGKFVSALFCTVLSLFCLFSVAVNVFGDNYSLDVPTLSVVKSGSMSYKNEKNKYLLENGLDNQLQTFDLIVTEKLPGEFDLQLFDIVVYEVDGMLLVHRIVDIEEPNQRHPNERYFLLQGDAVENPDRFPVRYSQMRGIYSGKRVPFIGSFVTFLQSPAGYLCIILVVFALFATPIMDKKIERAKRERLALLQKQARDAKKKVLAKKKEEQEQKSVQWSAPVCLYPVYYHENPPALGQVVPPNTEVGKK